MTSEKIYMYRFYTDDGDNFIDTSFSRNEVAKWANKFRAWNRQRALKKTDYFYDLLKKGQTIKIKKRDSEDIKTFFKDNNNRCFFIGNSESRFLGNYLSKKSKAIHRSARIALEYALKIRPKSISYDYKDYESVEHERKSWTDSILKEANRYLYLPAEIIDIKKYIKEDDTV